MKLVNAPVKRGEAGIGVERRRGITQPARSEAQEGWGHHRSTEGLPLEGRGAAAPQKELAPIRIDRSASAQRLRPRVESKPAWRQT